MASGELVRQGSSAAGEGGWKRMSVMGWEAAGRTGSSGCGQFEKISATSISARRSTKSPGRLRAVFQTKRPLESTETGAKKVTQGGMSRRPRPILAAAAMKFSWLLRVV